MSSEWVWTTGPKDLTLESIFQSKDSLCFLAGSGISLDPPSCLPTGYQFTKAVLERLIPEEERQTVLSLMDPEREGMRDPGDFLRFEQLMEYMQGYDLSLSILNCFADITAPNFNHLFLARMITKGYPVLTTNFDSLIEHALMQSKIKRKEIFPVITRQDWETEVKRKQHPVYKLHGSLFDVRNELECRDSIQATLTTIAQEKSDSFQLETWKRDVLSSILQDHDVVVLGYSGLDDFDVLPTLFSIPSKKRVLWINHANISLTEAKIDIISPADAKSFQTRAIETSRADQNLLMFNKYGTREASQITKITVHTRQLLIWLWKLFIDKKVPSTEVDPCPDADIKIPNNYIKSKGYKWSLTGSIYVDRNLIDESLRAYQNALKLSGDDKLLRGMCLGNIGYLLSFQGKLDEALNSYQQALKVAEDIKNTRLIATTTGNIGGVLGKQGRYEEALTVYQRALKLDKQQNDLMGISISLTNIGGMYYALKKYDEAINYYKEALKISESMGDLRSKAIRLNNIGLTFEKQGKRDNALDQYKESLKISEQIGDLSIKASCLVNIGKILDKRGQPNEALRHYQQALQIDEQMGNFKGKAASLYCIGQVFYNHGQYDKVINVYIQALQIYQHLEDQDMIAEVSNNLGMTYYNVNQFDEAIKHIQQSLVIDEQRGNLESKATSLNNLGLVYYKQGKVNDAMNNFLQALKLDEQLGNLSQVALRISNIGHILFTHGKYDLAIKYYQRKLQISRQLGNQREEADDLNFLGVVLAKLGQHDNAVKILTGAATIAKQINAQDLLVTILDNLKMLEDMKK
ncbi:MAG: tetratricopeptide repeat protein [Candidatus Odinarchaeota archaeon]